MVERLLHLVNQHQAKIPWRQPLKRSIDRQKLTANLINPFRAASFVFAFQPLPQQAHDLAVGAAALAGILEEDDVVEGAAEDHGLVADVARRGGRRRR
jgi:hypothetical protein